MRRFIAATSAVLALACGLLVSPGSAAAAPAEQTSVVVQQDVTPQHHWVYYDWYWTNDNCHEAGERMMNIGMIYAYSCTFNFVPPTWDLHVVYRH